MENSRITSTIGRKSRRPPRPEDTGRHEDGARPRLTGTLMGRIGAQEVVQPARSLLEVAAAISGEDGVGESSVIEKLNAETLRGLVEKYNGFGPVLSGQIPELQDGSYHLRPVARMHNKYRSDLHGNIPPRNGFSNAWETGANIGELIKTRPHERFKFYLSLDLSSEQKTARANEFLSALHAKAASEELSMLTKSEDHTYDSCNIYTWDPVEMAQGISELYKEFPDIWLDTEHPLQGSLRGVDEKHIGFVQEPIGGFGAGSHSARMGQLGKSLDQGIPYQEACVQAGVLAEAPWLISDPVG